MENQVLKAEKMIFGGNCIAKISQGENQGKTVLISGALPNEVVEVEFVSSTKDYEIAKVVKVIESSPFRVEPECKYFGRCGGCNLQYAQKNRSPAGDRFLKECHWGALALPSSFFGENVYPYSGS